MPSASRLWRLLCAVVAWVAASTEDRRQIAGLPGSYRALLQIGAALMVGCFFAGGSVIYRAIMLLLVLPGLLLLDRPAVSRRLRLLSRCTIVTILAVMFRLVAVHPLRALNLD